MWNMHNLYLNNKCKQTTFMCYGELNRLSAFLQASGVKLVNMQCSDQNGSLGEFQKCALKAFRRDVIELNAKFVIYAKPIRNIEVRELK